MSQWTTRNDSSSNNLSFDPHDVWQKAQNELALQMPAHIYDTWVRNTWVMAYEDGEFFIGMSNAYARDWLENRLRKKIKRTLTNLVGHSVQITFCVDAHQRELLREGEEIAPVEEIERGQYVQQGLFEEMATTPESSQQEVAINEATERILESASVGTTHDYPRTVGSASENSAIGEEVGAGEGFSVSDELRGESDRHVRDNNSRPGGNGLQFDAIQSGLTHYNGSDQQVDGSAKDGGNINPQHAFESFVVGNHNRLAHAAASAVADDPGQSFNPLFIYGGVGLGKTHLLHAIGNRARRQGYRMLYCTSEQFTNDLIRAIRSQDTEGYRNVYREVDILLVDDIQFIGGKESTQEEFFHTFNHLHASGRQVVLSSDRPPKALATLEERLRSRFEGGLLTDISQPDFETRVAILQSKASKASFQIPLDVLMLVAERVDSNVRELEGTLNRIILQARLFKSPLDIALAERILHNLSPQRTPASPSDVVRVVAKHYHLTPEDLRGRTRTKEVAHARQVAMYLLREENGLSLPAIGDQLGGRDHSTVRHGVEKVSKDLEAQEDLRREVMSLRDQIYTILSL